MLVFFIFRSSSSMSSSMSSMLRCKILHIRSSTGLEIEKSSLPESSVASMWTSNIRHPLLSLVLLTSSSSEKRVSFVFFFLLSPPVEDDDDCVGGLIPGANAFFFFFFPSKVKVALFLLLELCNEKERKREQRVRRGHHRYHEFVVVIPFVFKRCFNEVVVNCFFFQLRIQSFLDIKITHTYS